MSIRSQFLNSAGETLSLDAFADAGRSSTRLAPHGMPIRHVPHYAVAKRAIDLLIAVPALVLFAPLLLALALLIRMETAGPALFRQTRLGRGGVPFSIFKLRTMTVQENGGLIRQATANDARVTRLGRVLRAFSLDELPQLLNVILGDMSLVGPRPHAEAHDLFYGGMIANYVLRQTVKPGITGWAQIHGHRGETATIGAMRARVDLDIWYANHASLVLDLLVILRTPYEVLRRRNAH